jgi:hypothetical protein
LVKPNQSIDYHVDEPVWHCGDCKKIFTARNSDIQQWIQNNIPGGNTASIDEYDMHQKMDNKTSIMHGSSFYNAVNEVIQEAIRNFDTEFRERIGNEFERKVKEVIEAKEDSLTEIRKRAGEILCVEYNNIVITKTP